MARDHVLPSMDSPVGQEAAREEEGGLWVLIPVEPRTVCSSATLPSQKEDLAEVVYLPASGREPEEQRAHKPKVLDESPLIRLLARPNRKLRRGAPFINLQATEKTWRGAWGVLSPRCFSPDSATRCVELSLAWSSGDPSRCYAGLI